MIKQVRLAVGNALCVSRCAGNDIHFRAVAAASEPGDADADDLEPFIDRRAEEEALQDADDADPLAPQKPAFDPLAFERRSQDEERKRQERGNRGPDEEPGFGQGV